MKYYLIAGEASGDLHGANLMKALKIEDKDADFRYYGGDLMAAEGGTLVKHYADMAFMGFTEVLLNLSSILKNMRQCKADFKAYRPDVLILIDFPGFNLKMAAAAKALGIRVFYYISPKVWAWNQKRVLKIKKVVDEMFCILPFEVDFYKSWGMQVHYIGNPLLDAVKHFTLDATFRKHQDLSEAPILACLPGSRKQEIERLLPAMLQLQELFPQLQFIVAGAPGFDEAYYQQWMPQNKTVKVVFNQTYNLLAHAELALVASGTATLETALFKVPQVVVYKGGAISIAIARLLVKIRFISLVNLIMDRKVVTELIQEDCNVKRLEQEVSHLLSVEGRAHMLQDYQELAQIMGKAGASAQAAKLMVEILKS